MKRIVLIIILILSLLLGITYYRYYEKHKYIDEDTAKEIALKDLATNNKITFNKIEYTYTNKNYIYTLEFQDNLNVYTYKIDAHSKKIIQRVKESLTSSLEYLSSDAILDIVFKHASLNRYDCNLISNDVSLQEQIPIYNTIFYYNNIKYDYKTNALTGAILSVSKLKEN